MSTTPPVVLSIAATDSGGGAGLFADLATFAALGVHGTGVVTAVTAQDTTGVHGIHPVPLEIVAQQLQAVLTDLRPTVIKTGMLATADVVRLIAEQCAGRTLVVDPVLRSTTGTVFADAEVIEAYVEHLIPAATFVTPNEEEWRALGQPTEVLVTRGGDIETANDHGTGCTFASALAAYLALGEPDPTAEAHAFVAQQLRISKSWDLGRGRGPVAHIVPTTKEKP